MYLAILYLIKVTFNDVHNFWNFVKFKSLSFTQLFIMLMFLMLIMQALYLTPQIWNCVN